MMKHDQIHIFKLPTVKKTSYLKLYVLHAQVCVCVKSLFHHKQAHFYL